MQQDVVRPQRPEAMAKRYRCNDSQANQVLEKDNDDRRCVAARGLGERTHRRKAKERGQSVCGAKRDVFRTFGKLA
jgi:hypothetical protein